MAKQSSGDGVSYQDLMRANDEAQAAINQITNSKVTEAFAQINAIMIACNKENDKILKKAGVTEELIHVRLKTEDKKKFRNGKTRTYLNPHTGESLTTSGHNNNVLKGWKAQYGRDEVNGWIQ